jgi:hypothetical protein
MLYICKIGNEFDLNQATSVFSYIISDNLKTLKHLNFVFQDGVHCQGRNLVRLLRQWIRRLLRL